MNTSQKIDNPLRELISDEVFFVLQQNKLLDEKAVRDFQIRRTFRTMRETMSAGDAIDRIQEMYPYLQFDTIRKIVYQVAASNVKAA
jgi:hypothetical protein